MRSGVRITRQRGNLACLLEGRIGKAALQSYGEWELRGTGLDPGFLSTQLRAGFRVQQRGSASD